MKLETREKAFQKSIDFINNNINATSDIIPLELLESWIDNEPFLREEKGGAFQYTIFFLLLMKYKESQSIEQFDLSIEELQNIYCGWQTALSLTFLSKKKFYSIKSFPIFDFSMYEKPISDILYELGILI